MTLHCLRRGAFVTFVAFVRTQIAGADQSKVDAGSSPA
jgi:hypothetical protein